MENVLETLQEIMTEGGDNNFFIIHLNEIYYIQVLGQKGSTDVYCEAVSNDFLDPAHQLSTEQQGKMLELGWNDDNSINYSKEFIADTPKALTDLVNWIGQTATEVYGIEINDDTEYTIELE